MNKSETVHKTPDSNSKTKQDSITTVNQKEGHGVGIWGNPRIPKSYRIDRGLAEASKPVLQAIFGSECLPIECFLATILATAEAQKVYLQKTVNLGNTVGKEVKLPDIGKIVIQRNIRPRRHLRYDEPDANKYDPYVGWIFESDVVLNDNDHAVGCACKVCRG